jgi:hypothetical protein
MHEFLTNLFPYVMKKPEQLGKSILETLEMTARRAHLTARNFGRQQLPHGPAKSEDGTAQERLDDLRAVGIVGMAVDTQSEHLVEMGIEQQLVVVPQGHHVHPMDIHHLVPYVHLLTQEAPQDGVGQEHPLQVEVWTNHQVGDDHVRWNDGHLILAQLYQRTVHLALYLAVDADDDSTHRDVGSTHLGELLDAVDDDDVVVGISYLDVLIVCQCLQINLFLPHNWSI